MNKHMGKPSAERQEQSEKERTQRCHLQSSVSASCTVPAKELLSHSYYCNQAWWQPQTQGSTTWTPGHLPEAL